MTRDLTSVTRRPQTSQGEELAQSPSESGLSRRGFLGGAAVAGAGLAGLAAAAPAAEVTPATSQWHWLNITSERMPRIIEKVQGVCLLPWGCIERHGPHLPMGTDTLTMEAVTLQATEIEPAVVFPPLYFGQIAEARHCPGTISLDHGLLLQLAQAVLDEIGRNGFKKIVIVNGHGGNGSMIGYLLMSMLQRRRPYVVYQSGGGMSEADRKRWREMQPPIRDGHAGFVETVCMMAVRPSMVHLEECQDPNDGAARGRQKHLGGMQNSFSWYADYPTQFSGDVPKTATAEAGAFYIAACARELARRIKLIKADDVTARLAEQFYDGVDRVGLPPKPAR